ncbi:MAG: nickel pincer cofactor biosynthesis protein LarB [Methanobrevibacter sp.]|nr:nickel pincer cofactor biosynthesis protein LarB [Methanobrevibacter sp.]
MREILEKLINNEIDLDTAENFIKSKNILEFDEIAKFDYQRQSRTGFPEAVFSQSKDYDDLLLIIEKYFENENPQNLIVTKLSNERYDKLQKDLHYLKTKGLIFDYNKKAQILVIRVNENKKDPIAKIGIITAGTSDINIAEEAKVIVEEGGCEALTSYDIGVAGIHRLFPQIAYMIEEGVKVLIVCAGMEGALPSVVAGLVDIPVIAVPTSVGYGVGEGGRVALDAMLQSCAPGIAVVNIDNGFGAAVFALTIVKSSN